MHPLPLYAYLQRVALTFSLAAGLASAQDTTRVSVDSSGAQSNGDGVLPSISADGQIVGFNCQGSNLVPNDTNGGRDIFVHDRPTGITERVSVDSSGNEANADSSYLSISADGHVVVFQSSAWNLVPGDTNLWDDIFVHDRSTGITERVSVDSSGAEANENCWLPSISADGQIVGFTSWASNLVPGDTNFSSDIFIHDRTTGITERVNVDSAGGEADSYSGTLSISADGRTVAFASFADNLVAGDANGVADIFVHDRITGVTERVSIDSSGAEGNADSLCPSISSDGQVVAFVSDASNLVGSDKNGRRDVFVHDRQTGLTERVSVDSTGGEANADSLPPSISGDGLSVAFASDATNLVAGDTNKSRDVFVHDRSTGAIERVSIRKNGHEGYADSDTNSISTDGSAVAFSSRAANLVSGDTNGVWDVFVHEFCSIAASWSNYGVGFPGTTGIPTFTSRQNPVLGTTIARDLANSYGSPTLGLLLIGFQQASLHTNRGGDLLVVPAVVIPISFSYGGDTFTGDIPRDWSLCGIRLEAQAVEADPGAAKGVSFTSGLELVLGH